MFDCTKFVEQKKADNVKYGHAGLINATGAVTGSKNKVKCAKERAMEPSVLRAICQARNEQI